MKRRLMKKRLLLWGADAFHHPPRWSVWLWTAIVDATDNLPKWQPSRKALERQRQRARRR